VIDSILAGGVKAGYTFAPGTCITAGTLTVTFQYTAVPIAPGSTGVRYFCTDNSGILKFSTVDGATCLSSGAPTQ